MRSFVKIKSLQNGEITLSFTDIVKTSPSRKFLVSQKCYSTLFAKMKFSRKFRDLQYFLISLCLQVQILQKVRQLSKEESDQD